MCSAHACKLPVMKKKTANGINSNDAYQTLPFVGQIKLLGQERLGTEPYVCRIQCSRISVWHSWWPDSVQRLKAERVVVWQVGVDCAALNQSFNHQSINQSVNQNTPTQHRMSQANHRGECKQSSQYAMSNSSLFSLRVNVLISYKYMYVCLARRVLIAMLSSWYWLPPPPGAQRKGSYGECWVSNLFWN